MAKKNSNAETAFEVTCPCCSAVLKVDTETRAVIAHTAAVKPKMFNDMEAAAKSTVPLARVTGASEFNMRQHLNLHAILHDYTC